MRLVLISAYYFRVIVAIGIDLAEVERIAAAVERFGQSFLDRVFTAGEQAYCRAAANASERLAARFAAKEAVMKALGTGWGQGVGWRQIEVAREKTGRPYLILHDAAAHRAAALGIRSWALSLTHTHAHAIAQVIGEG